MNQEINISNNIKSEYKILEDAMDSDINHLDLKIADIEAHIQSINIQINQISSQITKEPDPVKRLNMNKGFSYLLRIYAELTAASHGFFSSKLAYRRNQEMVLRNKLKIINIDLPKMNQDSIEDLTVSKLVKLINNMNKTINTATGTTSNTDNNKNDLIQDIKSINTSEQYSLQ